MRVSCCSVFSGSQETAAGRSHGPPRPRPARTSARQSAGPGPGEPRPRSSSQVCPCGPLCGSAPHPFPALSPQDFLPGCLHLQGAHQPASCWALSIIWSGRAHCHSPHWGCPTQEWPVGLRRGRLRTPAGAAAAPHSASVSPLISWFVWRPCPLMPPGPHQGGTIELRKVGKATDYLEMKLALFFIF